MSEPTLSASQEVAEQWRRIAETSPAELYGRNRLARSLLQRLPESPDRVTVERALDGLPLDALAEMDR